MLLYVQEGTKGVDPDPGQLFPDPQLWGRKFVSGLSGLGFLLRGSDPDRVILIRIRKPGLEAPEALDSGPVNPS